MPQKSRSALWVVPLCPCALGCLLNDWVLCLVQGSGARWFVRCKVDQSLQLGDTMMAARFLFLRAAPALKQVRFYAEAVSGAPQMSFTFASPNEVQTLGLISVCSPHDPFTCSRHVITFYISCTLLLLVNLLAYSLTLSLARILTLEGLIWSYLV